MQYVTCVLLLTLLTTVTITAHGASRLPAAFQPPYDQQQSRNAIVDLPSSGNSIESYLQYCEAVIHALESELPRRSIFRSLFIDKARLSSGYDKHIRFSSSELIKDKFND
ncbi:uncharacterized protein LOC129724258 [Wyeomyia smithii]|uniref:uncharacterized protein LOC129724258 n=1 Tax=Wyeomyia smithii TaxID=174621 RepID=UPI002467B6DD|nr:uncharacterized protein LOC129724258 [Wyeomyia smithii]